MNVYKLFHYMNGFSNGLSDGRFYVIIKLRKYFSKWALQTLVIHDMHLAVFIIHSFLGSCFILVRVIVRLILVTLGTIRTLVLCRTP